MLANIPESPKENLKMKLKIAHILCLLSQLPLFQEELQTHLLPLISLDGLAKFKDSSLHESLIDIINTLYIPKSDSSKGSLNIIMANIMLVSGSIAAFIEHTETRIS